MRRLNARQRRAIAVHRRRRRPPYLLANPDFNADIAAWNSGALRAPAKPIPRVMIVVQDGDLTAFYDEATGLPFMAFRELPRR